MDEKQIIQCPECGAMGTKPTHRLGCKKVERFHRRWGSGKPKGPEPQGGKNPRKES